MTILPYGLVERQNEGDRSLFFFTFISRVMPICVEFKKSQIICHMEDLFTKVHGIIFLCLFQT